MPLESLSRNAGDCDTRAVLLGSTLANVTGTGMVFLESGSHLLVGIRTPPRQGERFVSLQGVDFVLVEPNETHPLGVVGANAQANAQVRIIQVL